MHVSVTSVLNGAVWISISATHHILTPSILFLLSHVFSSTHGSCHLSSLSSPHLSVLRPATVTAKLPMRIASSDSYYEPVFRGERPRALLHISKDLRLTVAVARSHWKDAATWEFECS